MLYFGDLNWWAIVVATAAAFVLGGLWYGPLFGKAWMDAIGKTEADLKPSPTPFIISFFAALTTCVVLAALIHNLSIQTLAGGLTLGALTGVGFIAASMASDSAFCRSGARLWVIQAGYRVVYSLIMGAILGAWQ